MDSLLKLTLFSGLALLGLAMAASAAADLLSDFASGKTRSRLGWKAPVEGPTYKAKDGAICVTVPRKDGGFNHWIESKADAPSLRADAPEGDWDLTGTLDLDEFAKDGSFHVGLMVGFSEGMVCIFGPFQDAAASPEGDWPEVRLEATGMSGLAKVKTECRHIQLRIGKRANEYVCFYRKSDSDEWTRAGEYLAAFPPEFVGVIGKTFGDGPGVKFAVKSLDVATVAAEPEMAEIKIDASKIVGKIDRNIYGHFIEHLGRCINEGIWAEMLWNRKFTGGVNERGVIESWDAFGSGAKYSRDNLEFYTASQSQRIELAMGREAGVLKKDTHLGIKPQKYVARGIFKQKGLSGGVTFALRQGSKVYASASTRKLGAGWSEYKVELDVKDADPDAQFSLSATGPGTLWIGCLSLMPADNVEGMRKDVLEAIREIKPPLIRWPGGNMVSGYHWEDGLGDRDRRMPRWERAWKTWEWNDFGTDDYIRFCRLVGTEPYICVNAGEGQADEAARWVEYCNGSTKTPYGKLRAANGHPKPYNVSYWGIGNEMYGHWQLGHLDATKYALKSIEFARAMKAVDPTIKLIGVGVDRDEFGKWNSTVAPIACSYYDYISAHYYKGPRKNDPRELTYLSLICASNEIEKMLEDTIRIVDKAAGRKMPLAFDEWNIWLPHGIDESMYALRDGLFAAGVFNALHRLSDHVTMANLAQLVNVLGAIQTNMTDVVKTPIHEAFDMYSNLCQDNRCKLACKCAEFDTPSGRMPLLDASATISDDGKVLVLAVINRDTTRDTAAKLDLKGFTPKPSAQLAAMNGPDAYTVNSFKSPEAVKITRSKAKLDLSQGYVFPAHSVTMITLAK